MTHCFSLCVSSFCRTFLSLFDCAFHIHSSCAYVQLKSDVVSNQLNTSDQAAVQLASYALQAEFGDFQDVWQGKQYFQIYDYFPADTVTNMTAGVRCLLRFSSSSLSSLFVMTDDLQVLEREMPGQHQKLAGMTQEQAITEYLKLAQVSCFFFCLPYISLRSASVCKSMEWSSTASCYVAAARSRMPS